MKFRKAWIGGFVLALALTGWLAAQAMAFGGYDGFSGHGGGGFWGLKTLTGLNLTEAQQAIISGIFAKYENDQQSLTGNLRNARKGLRTALRASPFDEAGIRLAYSQLATAQADLMVLRAKMMAEIKSTFTSDQLAKLDALKVQRLEKVQARVGSWLQNLQNPE